MPEQQEAGTPTSEPSFEEQVVAAETQDSQAQPEPTESTEAPQEAQPKTVPLEALHQSRANEKELKRQLREHQSNMEQLQRQQVEMMRYMQQAANPQPAVPSFEQDPLTNLGYGVAATNQQLQNLHQRIAQNEQQQVAAQQAQQFTHGVAQIEQAFVQQQPDYYEAVNWAKQRKAQEYVAAGMHPQQAMQRLNGEVVALIQNAIQNGDNPSELAYNMAKAMGYQPKTVSAEQKLAMQRGGQAAATPGSASGGSGGKLSLDSLAKLKGDDFLKATSGENWRKMMSR